MTALPTPFRPGLTIAATLLALACPSARADPDTLLKTLSIASSLGTWGVAAWQGRFDQACQTQRAARVQAATDKELREVSVGLDLAACPLIAELDGWSLDYSPTVFATHWQARGTVTGASSATDLAVVPLLHWRHAAFGGLTWGAEVGIGPSLLSPTHIGNRIKSTTFQFSDHLGLGLGAADRSWQVWLAYRHVSNANIRMPNNAVDFKGLALELAL